MIEVISGTNRPGSRTLQVAKEVLKEIQAHEKNSQLLDLAELPFHELPEAFYDGKKVSPEFQKAIDRVNKADGIVIVTPEYNGSYPGALKYFIDHWSYPLSFEGRPVAFVGLGFRWGGLRPVEHLQGVFGYRNAYMFPERVFLANIGDVLKDGKIVDTAIQGLIKKQADGFVRFIQGLKQVGLHPIK